MTLAHLLGLDSATSAYYLFWSGFGGQALVFAGLLTATARWLNCDERGCWHRGKYQMPESLLVVCLKHWRKGQLSADHGTDG